MQGMWRSLLAVLGFLFASLVVAQSYPERPVRIVVQFPPGSPSDLAARLTGQKLSEWWGRPVVVESMLGAAGNVAAAHVAKAPADGHTLLLSGDAAMTTNVTLYDKLPYDPRKDFVPITLALQSTNLLVVHPSVPARTVQELVALAKAQPGKLSYASAGSGTSQHLGGELMKQMANLFIVHIPYKGGPPALQDLMAGRVTFTFGNIGTVLPLVRDGKLRALAVSSPKRWPATPDIPSMAESGFPGFDATAWFGLLAPAGTPEPVVRKIHQDFVKALVSPDVKGKLAGVGLEVIGSSSQEFAAQIREEIERKGKVVRAAGAKPD